VVVRIDGRKGFRGERVRRERGGGVRAATDRLRIDGPLTWKRESSQKKNESEKRNRRTLIRSPEEASEKC